jgi:glycosyltransferase involved in cell wall biosynthesis
VSKPSYVLVTPVRNEEATIGITIESVVNQTLRPKEWIIVSDGSTDRTDSIVEGYAAKHVFIRLLRLEKRPDRNFASVVFALDAGIGEIRSLDYEFVGLLDADIRFAPDYYEQILARFAANPELGVAGGLVVDCHAGQRRRSLQTFGDVAGAVQFFRRSSFEGMGGLVAIREGGWDTVTCVRVRMQGFKSRTFPDLMVDHLKPRNIAHGGVFRRFTQLGVRDYVLGNHPLFETVKCVYRCFEYPYVVGGIMRWLGYISGYVYRTKQALTPDTIAFIRREQLGRLLPLHKTRRK